MNNDADQKVKWREWWICQGAYGGDYYSDDDPFYSSVLSEIPGEGSENLTHVIEAAPALAEIEALRAELRDERAMQSFGYKESKAEIESLRAENAELKKYRSELDDAAVTHAQMAIKIFSLKTKLKAATAQIEKMAEALQQINNEELNSQRPGGGYSRSATKSYEALAQYEQFKKELK